MNSIMCARNRAAARRHRAATRRTIRRTPAREAELRNLMTMTSHDLRSPLMTIALHLRTLREDVGAPAGDTLDVMDRAVCRIERLLDDLVGYARAEQAGLRLGAVALGDLVADVLADRVTAANQARVTVAGTLPAVHADPGLLRHLLDNLIGNAIKYTRPGRPARVHIRARAVDHRRVRIEVADGGIGIPAADRPRVFDAFHRSANSGGYQGTGLGLAICRRVVQRHGGRIGVAENPGGGSLFWFTLARAE